MSSTGVVIVGGGAAGLTAALECRRLYPDKPVTLVDREPEIGYYRTLLPMFMVRTLPEEKLFFWRPGDDRGLSVRLGAAVKGVDTVKRLVRLEDGTALAYERLILALGGRPVVPPVFGNRPWPKGAFPVRSLAMARQVRDWIEGRDQVVVLGGGLVGSKTSVFMTLAGKQVSLIEREAHILPTVLTAQAAAPMQAHLRAVGVGVHPGTTVDDYRTDAGGALSAVHVSSGDWIPCQTLLIGIGSAPDTGFLADSGLLEDGQLTVSEGLRTRDPYVFAVGDAVAIRRGPEGFHYPWTWPQAVVQGRYAGGNIYRETPLPIPRVTRVNAQNIAGNPIMILGGPGGGTAVVSRPGDRPGVWREFFLNGGRIAGGAFVGDIAGAGPLHALMVQGTDVAAEALDLLKPRTRAFAPQAWSHLAQKRVVATAATGGNAS